MDQLGSIAGITHRWKQDGPLDGMLILTIYNKEIPFNVIVRKELRQYQLNELWLLHQEYENLMIFAENIFPKIKNALRNSGIAYVETNGNLFIRKKEVYFFVNTNKNINKKKNNTNRAFTKTGLKVILHFLMNKNLVNKTQREIAETTGVALGNIPLVINGLKETGYLLRLNNKKYVWENRKELLEIWINKYATELRPKLKRNNYMLKRNWKELKLNNEHTVWGGEPAADLLTNYLRPEKFILYTREDNLNLMRHYHLIPKENGEVEVLEIFWKGKSNTTTAPPLLIYTDLILEGGKRNIETAQLIFNEYIEPNL